MKKLLCIILSVTYIFLSLNLIIPVLAATDTSVEDFADDMAELYSEESAKGKTIQESAKCRVVVKATTKPETYGKADCVVGNNNIYIYQYSDAETAQNAVEFYKNLRYVNWAELDGIVESKAVSYGNHMMQSDDAMEFIVNNNLPQNEIKVAMLDTGAAFSSPNLKGRVIDSGINLSESGTEGSAKADNSHGTYTSAVVVDNTPQNIKIYAYKVLDQYGSGTNSGLALGIDAAVADGADIINLSLGGDEYSQLVYDSIKAAYDSGVIVVCAAGNEQDDTSLYYPSSFDEVYTVGSIDKNGNSSLFTNYGERIDFVAPGHYVEVTPSKIQSGTSFSAPFITAAVATVLSVKPNYTFEQVKQCLIDSCVPYESLAYHDGFHAVEEYDPNTDDVANYSDAFMRGYNDNEKLYYGNGMPQIAKAVSLAQNDIAPPVISAESGIYHNSFEVTITAPEGCDIYYTSDESYPTKKSGTLYTAPIVITESQSVRAVAYSSDGIRSYPVSREYKMEYYANESDFEINSSGYIKGYSGNIKEFIVPDTVNGITVTGVDENAFDNNKNIIGITFPKTMAYIGYEAFLNSTVKYVTAPGLTYIDESGLQTDNLIYLYAPLLERVEITGLASTNLRTIEFENLIYAGQGAFSGNTSLKFVSLPKLEIISPTLFSNCKVLKTVEFEKATTIDAGAFAYCLWLKNIYIPNLTALAATKRVTFTTFYRCRNLVDIRFENLKTLAETRCFMYCMNLKNVYMPLVDSIPEKTFYSCIELESVNIDSAKTIGMNAFDGASNRIETLSLPNVTSIDSNAFDDCSIMLLDAPALISTNSLPTKKGATVILSSAFNECTVNATDSELTVYGTYGTYAETYAKKYGLTFIGVPVIVSQPVSVYSDEDETLEIGAIGFNLTYQWYGAEDIEGSNGKSIDGATNKCFKPSSIDFYPYYYCVVSGKDGEYTADVKTNYVENKLYVNVADYTELNTLLQNVPDDLSLYTEESVEALNTVISGIDWNLSKEEQDKIAEYISEITKAVSELKYKPADYSALDEVLATIPTNLTIYTDESVADLQAVVDGINRNLDITEQNNVDEYVTAVTNAVAALKLKSADYAELEEALKSVPSDLSIYTEESVADLKAVIDSIDRNLDITNQEQVNKKVVEIKNAVENLKLKPADYSAVYAAIATVPSDLSVYTDETVAQLESIIESVDYTLDITEQKQVDEYAEQINEAVTNLKKECWLIRLFKMIVAFFKNLWDKLRRAFESIFAFAD